jgi:hypothetical protein
MTIIKTNSWVAGEVNPDLIDAESNQHYTSAALTIQNMYVSKSQTLKRMVGNKYFNTDNAPLLQGDTEWDLIDGYEYNGVAYIIYITVGLILGDNTVTVNVATMDGDNFTVNAINSPMTLEIDVGSKITDYSFFNNQMILTYGDNPPSLIDYVNNTIIEIEFINPPTINTELFDYTDFSFVVSADNGSGIATVVVTGTDVVNSITTLFINGLFESIGDTVTDYLGQGKITDIVSDSVSVPNTVTMTLNIIYEFKAGTYTGDACVLQQPLFYTYLTKKVYPRLVTFYQYRAYMCSTSDQPMLIAGSKINSINNFDVGKGLDAEAIVEIMNDGQASYINHIIGQIGLFALTNINEYAVTGSVDEGITPSGFGLQLISNWGSNPTKPVIFNKNVFFTTRSNRKLIGITVPSINNYKVTELTLGMLISNDIGYMGVIDDTTIDNKTMLFGYSDTSVKYDNCLFSSGGLVGKTTINLYPEATDISNIITIKVLNKTYLILMTTNNVFYSVLTFIANDFRLNVQDTTPLTSITVDNDSWLYNPTTLNYKLVNGGDTVTVPLGYTTIGESFNVYVKSMPLSYQNESSYDFQKISKFFISYYESARLTVNGVQVAYPNEIELNNPEVLKTAYVAINNTNTPDQRQYIEVSTTYPFNVEILSYGWSITTKEFS